jgi:hypothetical protein
MGEAILEYQQISHHDCSAKTPKIAITRHKGSPPLLLWVALIIEIKRVIMVYWLL